ncbi:unnamed protein product [Euphydryas editha]|uniref:DRBM domain-containing protein n=1 Tax=Euphydryas editha TaxID=104508 RepID=A0AAU9UCP5_EUPED|nr:unnamed protein product [Euphydryas editha]
MKYEYCKATRGGATDCIICTKCKKEYLFQCLFPSKNNKDIPIDNKKSWICPECSITQPRHLNKDNTPVHIGDGVGGGQRGGRRGRCGGRGGAGGAGGAKGKPKELPANAASMHPCSLLTYMRPRLEYREVGASGAPPHNTLFTMAIDVDGTTYVGQASNKKEARKAAAKSACEAIFNIKFEN